MRAVGGVLLPLGGIRSYQAYEAYKLEYNWLQSLRECICHSIPMLKREKKSDASTSSRWTETIQASDPDSVLNPPECDGITKMRISYDLE